MKMNLAIAFLLMVSSACAHKKVESQTNAYGAATDGPAKIAETKVAADSREAIKKMAGCYLVDYNYSETEAIKKGYTRDARLYDVNKVKSVKEWIYAEDVSPNRIRLQHVLFAVNAQGELEKGSELKHQAEDWESGAQSLYEFTSPGNWKVTKLEGKPDVWTRKITNLDDGLRYQCAAAWDTSKVHPEWSCDNFSPIPGRETRDMARKDYNTMERSTKLVVYGDHWLERQTNTKVIYKDGVKTPLAKENGKNWYVRLPDSQCGVMQSFVNERRDFWALLRDTWDEVFTGNENFVERTDLKPPRFARMMKVESDYVGKNLRDPAVRAAARGEILKVIGDYRVDAKSTAAR